MTIVLQGCYDAVYTLMKSYLIAFIVTLMFILIVEVRIADSRVVVIISNVK